MIGQVWGALAAAAVALGSVAGFGWQPAATEASVAKDARLDEHEDRIAEFARYLSERRAAALSAVPADPFAQLARLGLDGEGLRRAAETADLYLGAVETLDLSRIDLDSIDRDERRCLTQAIYYEARNQSDAGKMAVADVVMNRVDNPRYPATVCGVVFQGAKRRTGCQFSFTCDGSMKGRVERRAMVEAQTLATAILGGFRLELTGGATNYHADYVRPYWAPTLTKTAVVGNHIFYRRGRAPQQLAMLN